MKHKTNKLLKEKMNIDHVLFIRIGINSVYNEIMFFFFLHSEYNKMADRKKSLMKKFDGREPLSPISGNRPHTPHKRSKYISATMTPNAKTPSKRSAVVSEGYAYDRFIPNRALIDPQVSLMLYL